ncbi:MAG: GNAT family N-acetyltransferase [Porphyromonas sp.]|nr:GNAT family N-acetyltransferase [Porphyromonas sp.]
MKHPDNYQDLIAPIDPAIIKAELSEQHLLRKTNRAGNELYTFRAQEAPNTMLELGRLREEAFRYYGGGTGKPADIDEFDLDPDGYYQLIVWDPEEHIILGGYRYMLGGDVKVKDGKTMLASSEIFDYSDLFLKEYLPRSIELGRSFVRVDYQQAGLRPKSIFALDNLWDGLGALILIHDQYEYFFGKVTMYKDYNRQARDLIIYYMNTHFRSEVDLMHALYPVPYETPVEELAEVIKGEDAKADYKALNKAVRDLGVNIPPLVNAYIGLSSSLMVFDVSLNAGFSNVEETGIMIPMLEITEDKKRRHIESFLRDAAKKYRPNLIARIRKRLRPGTASDK